MRSGMHFLPQELLKIEPLGTETEKSRFKATIISKVVHILRLMSITVSYLPKRQLLNTLQFHILPLSIFLQSQPHVSYHPPYQTS